MASQTDSTFRHSISRNSTGSNVWSMSTRWPSISPDQWSVDGKCERTAGIACSQKASERKCGAIPQAHGRASPRIAVVPVGMHLARGYSHLEVIGNIILTPSASEGVLFHVLAGASG